MLLFIGNSFINVSQKICFHDGDNIWIFILWETVYFGDFNYTAHHFPDKAVWFQDGIITKRQCKYEKRPSEFTDAALSTCKGKILFVVFYTQCWS